LPVDGKALIHDVEGLTLKLTPYEGWSNKILYF
jgi:hypothetical protein